jgi:DNA-binding transcriptional regulator YhcF (GntR family)
VATRAACPDARGQGGDVLDLSIDGASSVPPYEQLRAGLAERIVTGRLAVGVRLPTVRQLAVDLGVAANTVARAYRELEAAQLIVTRGRAGTFVHTPDAARQLAAIAARAFADAAHDAGLDVEEAVEMLRAAARER